LTWDNDGFGGRDDPNSSNFILIDWLTKPGNYSTLWKGKHNGGRTKEQICEPIVADMMAAGVK
jgi:hypothetical protein